MVLKIAKDTFVAGTSLGSVVVHKGESYDERDPLVLDFPGSFVTAEEWATGNQKHRVVHSGVEAATAAPGEKRTVTRPKKK
jgi:hypothetical protein